MSECSLKPAKMECEGMMYVGVDVGKSKCRAAMMNQEGKITKEFGFSNDSEGISRLSSMLTVDDRVVMESTGAYWLDLYNQLDELHIPVVLANSARLRLDSVDHGLHEEGHHQLSFVHVARRDDPEAGYNGYYKKRCYLVHRLRQLRAFNARRPVLSSGPYKTTLMRMVVLAQCDKCGVPTI